MRISGNKKGVELTLGTVIIAVLVVIVLIVLIVILNKGSGGLWDTISSCEDRKGQCVSDAQSCTSMGGRVYRIATCDHGGVCCIPQDALLGSDQNEFE
jgi:hypothetical protein